MLGLMFIVGIGGLVLLLVQAMWTAHRIALKTSRSLDPTLSSANSCTVRSVA